MAQSRSKRNTNSRKSTTSKSNPKKNTKSKSRSSKQPSAYDPFYDEIILICTLVISVISILGFFDLGGPVSGWINYFTFGITGILAYILPFILFIGIAFGVSNRGNQIARRKMISSLLLLLVVCSFLHVITYYGDTEVILDYYQICATENLGGGVIGATIAIGLERLFGIAGTYVILIAVMIVLVMFITGKFFFATVSQRGMETIHNMRQRRQEYAKEIYEEEDEESNYVPMKRKAKTYRFPTSPSEVEEKQGRRSNRKKKKSSKLVEVAHEGEETPILVDEETGEIYQQELRNKFEQRDVSVPREMYVPMGSVNQELDTSMEEAYVPEADFDDMNFEITRMEHDFNSTAVEDEIIEEEMPMEASMEENEEMVLKQEKIEENKEEIQESMLSTPVEPIKKYEFPPINLLTKPKGVKKGTSDHELKETAKKLQSTLDSFGVRVTITNVSCGPTVTRYELQPEQGVKVSKITNLADDIKLNLAAADIRIEAPIPGKAAVGIEVPNRENSAVMFRELIESNEFKHFKSDIAFAVGKDIGGQTVVTDIGKMPHLLIAGATGSGKSVCINTLIMSILYKADPNDVKLIMVDPKVVELSVYNGIPHLLIPVVTDPKKASAALNWAVAEMTERYKKFADLSVRDIKGYNKKIESIENNKNENFQKMPQIVIIVDELADLMMVAPGEVEDAICRLAQMARAAGIHLIIATQRPSVNVITGLIKANVPSRIAFSVSSAIDSRTILDGSGAEKLLGKGDMLFFPSGYPKPVRIQGAFVSDKEVSAVVEFLSAQKITDSSKMDKELEGKITSTVSGSVQTATNDRDEYFVDAGKFIIEKDKASIGMLQRVFKIGFNRAARIMDQLNDAGVVGPDEGTKPRKVMMSMEEFEQYIDEYV